MQKPQHSHNPEGNERHIGLEIEYAGLSLDQVSNLIQSLFGGEIAKETEAIYKVKESELGDFTVEIDAWLLQKIAEDNKYEDDNTEENLIDNINLQFFSAITNAGSKMVPFEIVSPPIKISQLDTMETLRKSLLHAGAKGTSESIYSAFGLHINPEVASLETSYIVSHLQSFLLLFPWLMQLHQIDLTRRITSFIDPFPKAYIELVLDTSYTPKINQLIKDYHKHNPTRNRALDLLPLFAYINDNLVRELYGTKEKINKRPTFHYRLPNCDLSNKDWTFNQEWECWLYVEKLANNKNQLHNAIDKWQKHQKRWYAFEDEWVEEISNIMENI